MTIEARLSDGTVLTFPEGTDPAVIQRVVRQQIGQQSNQRTALGDTSRSIGDVATDFFQRAGDTTGFVDEMRAAGWTGLELAGDLLTGEETEGGIRGAWQRARERDAATSQLAEQRQGSIERVASDTLGLGTTLAVPAAASPSAAARGVMAAQPAAARLLGMTIPGGAPAAATRGLTMPAAAATRAGRFAQNLGYGGLGGGLYGATQGDSLQERSDNALGGMVLGAGFAAAAPVAFGAVGSLGRLARRILPSRTPGAGVPNDTRAAQRVYQRLRSQGMSPTVARRRLVEMRAAGVSQASLLDTGDQMRGLGRAVRDMPGSQVGASGRNLGDFVETRADDAASSVAGRIRRGLVPEEAFRNTPPADLRTRYMESVREITRPLFRRVQGMARAPRIMREVLGTNYGKTALNKAISSAQSWNVGRRGADVIRIPTRADLYRRLPNGRQVLRTDMPEMDIRFLHELRMALDDIVEKAQRRGEGRTVGGVSNIRNSLDRILKRFPAMRRADAEFSRLMRGVDGLEWGGSFDQMSVEQLRTRLQSATSAERAMARISAANSLARRVQDRRDPTTLFRRGGNRIQVTRLMFGDDEVADMFARHIEAQRQVMETANAVTGGSQTSFNQAQIANERAQTIANSLGDFVASGGNIVAGLLRSASSIIRRLPGGISRGEREALIDILTETDPEKLRAIFNALDNVGIDRAAGAQAARGGAALGTVSQIQSYTTPQSP
jgi:hypothetical protein